MLKCLEGVPVKDQATVLRLVRNAVSLIKTEARGLTEEEILAAEATLPDSLKGKFMKALAELLSKS